MTIGNELDETFYKLGQRLTALENNQNEFAFQEDTKNLRYEVGELNAEAATFATYAQLKKIEAELADKETVLGIEADLTGQIERLEVELNDRIDEVENDMGFDPDDLRCDLECRIEEVADNLSYESDRIDDIECYMMRENDVDYKIEEAISDRLDDLVCDAVNERAVPYNDFWKACERIRELEDRLNKPSLTARIMRWLREGPSIKEVATSWYAGIRRGS